MASNLKNIDGLLREIERQNKGFELAMKMARLQEPSAEAVLLARLHRELLAKMQQEMRGCFQTLEEGMRKRLEDVEQCVVASVRDILPGIIRDEMRKLLVEQKDLEHRLDFPQPEAPCSHTNEQDSVSQSVYSFDSSSHSPEFLLALST